jgi:hypothetical protein
MLSIKNVELFFNTFPHMQVNIFFGSYHELNTVDLIRHVAGSDTMKKFITVTHFIKSVHERELSTLYKYVQSLLYR